MATVRRIALPLDQRTTIRRLRVTTPARTLVDAATALGPIRLRRLVDEALHARATSPLAVRQVLGTATHIRPSRVRSLLDALEVWDAPIRPDSAAEARLFRHLDAWGLPAPERQIPVTDASGRVIARLDGGWPDRRVGFEYDSIRWHGPAALEPDEVRHQRLVELGWTVLHVDRIDLAPGQRNLRDRLLRAHAARSLQVPARPA